MKLKKSLTFNDDVGPACLPDPSFAPEKNGELAVVSGWGTTMEGNSKSLLFYFNPSNAGGGESKWKEDFFFQESCFLETTIFEFHNKVTSLEWLILAKFSGE